MLLHPTLAKLEALGLFGMARALNEQLQQSDDANLTFEERLGLLVDREATDRDNRRTASRLKRARLRQEASPEDVDLRHRRGLDRAQFLELSACRWIQQRHNLLITGPTGIGKTFLACALAQKACRDGYTVLYRRTSSLMRELTLGHADGTFGKELAALARIDLLVLDDWGLMPWTDSQRRDLWELLDDRHERRSTLVTSQLPVGDWYDALGDPTLADAILDRLIHNAHKLALDGESLRKQRAAPTTETKPQHAERDKE